jgi:hypothetical protein
MFLVSEYAKQMQVVRCMLDMLVKGYDTVDLNRLLT